MNAPSSWEEFNGARRGLRARLSRRLGRAGRALVAAPDTLRTWRAGVLIRALRAAPPRAGLRIVAAAQRLDPGSAFLVQARALLTVRAHGWTRAAAAFREAAESSAPGAAQALLRRQAPPPLALAEPHHRLTATLPADAAGRIVVYTAAFGEARPMPIFQSVPGVRFICLTDRADLAVPGWTCMPSVPPEEDAADRAAWAMILPHLALGEAAPDAEASLFVAPHHWLTGNLQTLLGRWCLNRNLVLWPDPDAADWHGLAEAALIGGAEDLESVIEQAADCERRSLPRGRGAYVTDLIWRRHGQPEIAALMEAWWSERQACPGLDAISLYAILNESDGRPRPLGLPGTLGTIGVNAFSQPAPPRLPPEARARRPEGRLRVAFVYSERHAQTATTELRARQFSALLARTFGDRYDVTCGSTTDGLEGAVVVLVKAAISDHTPQALRELRARNLAVISSWDDGIAEPSRTSEMTANMTMSYRQTLDHGRAFPKIPSYLVGNQVNVLIPPSKPPADRFRCAYFGDPGNTYWPEGLRGLVDLVDLNTFRVDMGWIGRLPDYNCHWLVRRYRDADGGKPFLKGFVAARCGAVVIVGRDDDDALQYLGDDYPFFVDAKDPATLERRVREIAAAFGGPDWRLAKEIMGQVAERSADAIFCAEFDAMVEDLLA